MTYAPVELLTVHLDAGERRRVGRLALSSRRILFEYDPSFVASGVQISPFKLPLKPGVQICPDMIFDGLFGVFNDSLPDGWGRLLLDRAVEKHGVNRGQLNPLDRLAYVGGHGMGALSYEPDRSPGMSGSAPLRLDKLAEEAAIVLAGEHDDVFEELLRLNGSSAGARPKIVAQVSPNRRRIIHGAQSLHPGYSHWIIKFPSSQDARDAGKIEYAYSLMAKNAGVDMPETHVFRANRKAFFGARRFDRQGDRRIHMHSLSGLIHADHRTPSLDYDMLLRVTRELTKSAVEVEKAYALACFNVLAHNRDDHAKNFSFLLNERNEWKFSPAYDLTFSYGPGGEQSMMVLGEGKRPGPTQLQALGRQHGLKNASDILARAQETVSCWKQYAEEAGVSARLAQDIAKAIGVGQPRASRRKLK